MKTKILLQMQLLILAICFMSQYAYAQSTSSSQNEQKTVVHCNCRVPGFGCGLNAYCKMACFSYCRHHHPVLPDQDVNGNYDEASSLDITNTETNLFTVSFFLDQKENVSLSIYDLNGRFIKSIADDFLDEGDYNITLNADEITSGAYFLRMKKGDNSQMGKLIVSK